MKSSRLLQSFALFALAGFSQAASAQESINVHLEPNAKSTLIGKLDSRSLSVNAEWPKDRKPVSNWQPIYYRGAFLVYLDSYDLGKNNLPAPGSHYLLGPSKNAPVLAIATDEDKAEIITIDPRYCHINLETIVLGYIEDDAAPPPTLRTATAPISSPTLPAELPNANEAIKTFEGILVSTTSFESGRTGYRFKLINTDNKTIAFVDPSSLPEYIILADYINAKTIASGKLMSGSNEDYLILNIQSLKKKH
jgi:hypothetical protein